MGGCVNSQIYSNTLWFICREICHILDWSGSLCVNVYLGMQCLCAILYRLELGLFSSLASQEMKLYTGCCGKETLPVYP